MIDYKYILIVDNNEPSNFLHSDAVRDSFPNSEIISYTNSTVFTIACLAHSEWFENETLLLLDSNMPINFGYDVLEEIEEEIDDLDHLSVLMVTSSNLKRDVERAVRFSSIKGYVGKLLGEAKMRVQLANS